MTGKFFPNALLVSGTALCLATLTLSGCGSHGVSSQDSAWIKIDDFESQNALDRWIRRDTRNDTSPRVENPQVTEVRTETGVSNRYLLKKPAAEGVVGNRKALTYSRLPKAVEVGETWTFYTRLNVEKFPNNHAFGLSNLDPEGIDQHDYNAFEPALRVTDKWESDGSTNDGTLMVIKGEGKNWRKINNFKEGRFATPMQPGIWYELWYVVNNSSKAQGGQSYDLYVRGGDEFPRQAMVFKDADFRMKRELPLIYFLMNCNTGPAEKPYGNGGLLYDDLYMARGVVLSSPTQVP